MIKNLLRRIRGAIGIGVTWALGWTPVGALYGVILELLLPPGVAGLGLTGAALAGGTILGAMGFVGGLLFSGALQ